MFLQVSLRAPWHDHLDFVHHEDRSAAPSQPKLGISPAKTPRPLRSEKMVKRIRKDIYFSPPNLATLRLGGRNTKSENFRPLKICANLAVRMASSLCGKKAGYPDR